MRWKVSPSLGVGYSNLHGTCRRGIPPSCVLLHSGGVTGSAGGWRERRRRLRRGVAGDVWRGGVMVPLLLTNQRWSHLHCLLSEVMDRAISARRTRIARARRREGGRRERRRSVLAMLALRGRSPLVAEEGGDRIGWTLSLADIGVVLLFGLQLDALHLGFGEAQLRCEIVGSSAQTGNLLLIALDHGKATIPAQGQQSRAGRAWARLTSLRDEGSAGCRRRRTQARVDGLRGLRGQL